MLVQTGYEVFGQPDRILLQYDRQYDFPYASFGRNDLTDEFSNSTNFRRIFWLPKQSHRDFPRRVEADGSTSSPSFGDESREPEGRSTACPRASCPENREPRYSGGWAPVTKRGRGIYTINAVPPEYIAEENCSVESRDCGGIDRYIGKDEAVEGRYGRSGSPRLRSDM